MEQLLQEAIRIHNQQTLMWKNKVIALQEERDNLQARELDGDILFKWLKKAYEMGVKRDTFSDQQSECDLPTLDLSYVPKMKAELEQATKEQH